MVKERIKKYLIPLLLGLACILGTFFLRFDGLLTSERVCLYASDACFIVGGVYLAVSGFCWLYKKGAFDGLSLILLSGLNKLVFSKKRKIDYRERVIARRRIGEKGFVGRLLAVGSGFLAAAVFFCLNFY